MKETLLRWLEPVTGSRYYQVIAGNDFLCGVIAGILLVCLLWLLCRIIFRRRSCPAITVANEFGTMAVGSNAVFSVIKFSCSSIKCLEFTKLEIYRKKDEYHFFLRAVMDVEQGSVPQLMEKIALIIRKEMTAVFAVDNIGEIKLTIASCKRLSGEEEKEENKEFPDFIDAVEKNSSKDAEHTISLRHGKYDR